jgi:hypothetical protein
MRYLDYALAWILLITAVIFILVMEITHTPGSILDIPFLWLVIAMMNFVRLRNHRIQVWGLRTSCIGANLVGLMLEVVRFRLFGVDLLRHWGPYTAIAAVAILGELVFSIGRRSGHNSAARI